MGLCNGEKLQKYDSEDDDYSTTEDDKNQSDRSIITPTTQIVNSPPKIVGIGIFGIMIYLLVRIIYVETTNTDKMHFSCNYTDLMMPQDELDKVSSKIFEYQDSISAMKKIMALDIEIYSYLHGKLKSLESTYQDTKKVYDYEKSLQEKCDFIKTIAIKKLAFKHFEFLRCIFVPFYTVGTILYGILCYREWRKRRGMTGRTFKTDIKVVCLTVFIFNAFIVYIMFDNEKIWDSVEKEKYHRTKN